jgi:exonuclease VII large subunit
VNYIRQTQKFHKKTIIPTRKVLRDLFVNGNDQKVFSKGTPFEIRDGGMVDVIKNLSSNIAKLKKGTIKHFDLQFRKVKNSTDSISVPSKCYGSSGMFKILSNIAKSENVEIELGMARRLQQTAEQAQQECLERRLQQQKIEKEQLRRDAELDQQNVVSRTKVSLTNDSLADRMKGILNTAKTVKAKTDKGELPEGFAEFAEKEKMSLEDQAEFLAFQHRLASGTIKFHSDGKGMDIGL